MNNLEMFWTIFGAVGTTFGTLVTAIAVIIAIHQYKQPIIKGISIRFSLGLPLMDNNTLGKELFVISVSNSCLRNINITGIFVNVDNKDIADIYDKMQYPFHKITFPKTISPEDNIEYRILLVTLKDTIKNGIERKELRSNGKMKIHVRDSSGKNYYKKLKCTASDFLK